LCLQLLHHLLQLLHNLVAGGGVVRSSGHAVV
jgi:hypothetical protein